MIRVKTPNGKWIGGRAIPSLPTDQTDQFGRPIYQGPFLIGDANRGDGFLFLDLDLNDYHIKYLNSQEWVSLEEISG